MNTEGSLSLNQALFYWINQDGGHHYGWLDAVMRFLSTETSAVVPFLLLAFYALWRGGMKGRHVVIGVLLLAVLTDWSGAQLKHFFAAPRPCEVLPDVRLLEPCGRNSFPSNHAINMAAVAVYVGLFYSRLLPWLAVVAVLVGISRIYVGVHYPLDVFFGWLWGALLASGFYFAHRRFFPHDARTRDEKQSGKPADD
jgi:undecaprenyl-diphosphatase